MKTLLYQAMLLSNTQDHMLCPHYVLLQAAVHVLGPVTVLSMATLSTPKLICSSQVQSRDTSRNSQKIPRLQMVIMSSTRTWILFPSWNLVIMANSTRDECTYTYMVYCKKWVVMWVMSGLSLTTFLWRSNIKVTVYIVASDFGVNI